VKFFETRATNEVNMLSIMRFRHIQGSLVKLHALLIATQDGTE